MSARLQLAAGTLAEAASESERLSSLAEIAQQKLGEAREAFASAVQRDRIAGRSFVCGGWLAKLNNDGDVCHMERITHLTININGAAVEPPLGDGRGILD